MLNTPCRGGTTTHHANGTIRRFRRGYGQIPLAGDQTWPRRIVVSSRLVLRYEIGIDRDAGRKLFRGPGASAYVYVSSSNEICRVVIECQPILDWGRACGLDRSDLSLQMSE